LGEDHLCARTPVFLLPLGGGWDGVSWGKCFSRVFI
jgi:hypothetical protein